MIFQGSGVALVTPFTSNNKVDYYSLKHLIDFQIASGTKAIIILGTTGEASTITDEERTKIIKFTLSLAKNKIKIIVGTGSNSTEKAIKYSKEAEALGADGVLVVTPYYNKCNQEGLYLHFKHIANSIIIPIILYNVPTRTGVNLLPQTALKLSKIINIVGIKQASSNLSELAELCHILPLKMAVYSGDDLLTLPAMSLGASGVISVTANIYPEQISAIADYALSGDFHNAKRIHNSLFEVNKALFVDTNPIPIKAYMNLKGFAVGKPRLPLTEASVQTKKILKEVLDRYEN